MGGLLPLRVSLHEGRHVPRLFGGQVEGDAFPQLVQAGQHLDVACRGPLPQGLLLTGPDPGIVVGEDGERGEGRVAVERVEEAQRLAVGHVQLQDDAVEGIGCQGRGGLPRARGVDHVAASALPRHLVAGGDVPVGALGDEGEQAVGPFLDHEQAAGPPLRREFGGTRTARTALIGRLGRVAARGRRGACGKGGVGVRGVLVVRAADRQVEGEGAALAGRALRGDGPAEELGDLSADGEPEAGAAVLAAGGAVGLLEGSEDGLQLLLGDADARVPYPEGQQRPAPGKPGGDLGGLRRFDAELDAAALGELDRVGQQVAQDLAQPRVVGEQVVGGARGGGDGEVEALLRGHRPEGRVDVLEQLGQVHPLGMDVHLAASTLDRSRMSLISWSRSK